jgi:DNA-binding transcriptional regulator YiaG
LTIKEARKKAGLTQAKMSDLLEIPKRTIGDWETGTRKPPAYVEKLVIRELERIATENNNK